MARTISINPITEALTMGVRRIWKEESARMVKELTERVTARTLELEQKIRVAYQRDVELMETRLYVVLPGETEIVDG